MKFSFSMEILAFHKMEEIKHPLRALGKFSEWRDEQVRIH